MRNARRPDWMHPDRKTTHPVCPVRSRKFAHSTLGSSRRGRHRGGRAPGRQSLQMARKIGTIFKPVLNFHIMMNSIGYFAGMTHGLMLSRHLDSVSLSLAIVMSVMMVSGLLLKYPSSRNSKIFGKLLHGQFGLVILLAALVVLHIVVGDD